MFVNDNPPRQARTVTNLLKVHTRLDLTVGLDLLKDQADVRQGLVLSILPNQILIRQTHPPILESMVGREVTASFISRCVVQDLPVRWGWYSRIEEYCSDYQPWSDSDETVEVIKLAVPGEGYLTSANLRLHYRVTVGNDGQVVLKKPSAWRNGLILDLSFGGALVELPAPVAIDLGSRFYFTIGGLLTGPHEPAVTINGEAELVCLRPQPHGQTVLAGLKFLNLMRPGFRLLQKTINHYMRGKRGTLSLAV